MPKENQKPKTVGEILTEMNSPKKIVIGTNRALLTLGEVLTRAIEKKANA